MLGWDFKVNAHWDSDQDLCGTCDINSTLGSVVPLAIFEYHIYCTNLLISKTRNQWSREFLTSHEGVQPPGWTRILIHINLELVIVNAQLQKNISCIKNTYCHTYHARYQSNPPFFGDKTHSNINLEDWKTLPLGHIHAQEGCASDLEWNYFRVQQLILKDW